MATENPFALPGLFRVSAIDGRGEGWRNEALHFRVHSHPLLGIPLHPFVGHPLREFRFDEVDVHWTTRDGRHVDGTFNPSHHDVVFGRILGRGGQLEPPEWCWVDVTAAAFSAFGDFRMDSLARATLGNGADRVLATRRAAPFAFAGSELSRLRVQGHGEVGGLVSGIVGRRLDITSFEGDPPLRFGIRTGRGPWYDPGPDPDGDTRDRIRLGVFSQPGPPDEPDPGATPLDPDVEAARVLDQLGPELVDPWLRAALDDARTPPGAAYAPDERTADNGVLHSTSMRAVDGLLTMAIDPEIARYLGLVHTVDVAKVPIRTGPNVWLIAGRWIARAGRHLDTRGTTLRQWIDARPIPSWLSAYLDSTFPEAATIAQRIQDENQGVDPEEAWSVVTLFTAAVFAGRSDEGDPRTSAAPDRPDRLSYEIRLPSSWNPGPEPAGWTQSITLTDRPAQGPLAFARLDTGGAVSLHRKNPGGRAAALLAPWSPKGDRIAAQGGLALQPRERTVTDGDVPADHIQGDWRLWQADEWGRWSEPIDVSTQAPARPLPPPPELEAWFEPAERDGAPGDRSPGTLRLSVRTRSVDRLSPGGRPLAAVTLSSDEVTAWRHDGATTTGSSVQLPVDAANEQVVEATVAPTAVGAPVDVVVTAIAIDAEGAQSAPPAELRRTVHDPRRPPPVTTGPRIVWASEPDATGSSELALRWAAPANTRFRVYLGDEHRLAAALGLEVTETELRAERARRIWERSHELAAKGAFTLLTEEPLVSVAQQVVYRERLPGTLRGVQFVRIVPVSAGGVEATFGDCPLVPVAVPTLDAPPPPAMRVASAAGGKITVAVEAHGIRSDVVNARGAAPRFRVKRTRGGATEALFMPPLFEGDLLEAGGRWHAEWVDGVAAALPPFVTHTYVVEVRYPPEPDLGQGVPPAAAVVGPAWDDSPQAAAAAWSAASVPASMSVIPADPPAAPAGVTFTRDAAGGATLTIPAPPLAHASARPFSALVVRETAAGRIETLHPVELTEAPATIHDIAPGVGYRVAFIDPLGRVGPLVEATQA